MKKGLGKNIRNKDDYVSTSDRNGFTYNGKDMVKQLEYRGNSLTWTGIMVGPDEVDAPQPQFRPFQPKKEIVFPANFRPYSETEQMGAPYDPDYEGFVSPLLPENFKPYYGN